MTQGIAKKSTKKIWLYLISLTIVVGVILFQVLKGNSSQLNSVPKQQPSTSLANSTTTTESRARLILAEDYESIITKYTKQLLEVSPVLIAEYKEEASENTKGLAALNDIMNQKIKKLGAVMEPGLAEIVLLHEEEGSKDRDKQEELLNKLIDVYQIEAEKLALLNQKTYEEEEQRQWEKEL